MLSVHPRQAQNKVPNQRYDKHITDWSAIHLITLGAYGSAGRALPKDSMVFLITPWHFLQNYPKRTWLVYHLHQYCLSQEARSFWRTGTASCCTPLLGKQESWVKLMSPVRLKLFININRVSSRAPWHPPASMSSPSGSYPFHRSWAFVRIPSSMPSHQIQLYMEERNFYFGLKKIMWFCLSSILKHGIWLNLMLVLKKNVHSNYRWGYIYAIYFKFSNTKKFWILT